MKKYLFIDRDGTLVYEPEDFQVDSLAKIRLRPYAIPALLRLRQAGYVFVMVSNQDGLGTPSFPLDTFTPAHEFILNLFSSQGIDFEQVLICPHKSEDNCGCRKPKLGMVEGYLRSDGWEREKSYFIGDRPTDEEMGRAMGIKSILISDSYTWNDIASQILGQGGGRSASVERSTKETQIAVSVDLDTPGKSSIDTGIGFFDHMLDQIATHARISIKAKVKGDLNVDMHHSIEDTALALGSAIQKALGDRRGITRFGFCLPMDEVYAKVLATHLSDGSEGVEVAVDVSGRPYANLQLDAEFTREDIGGFPTQMVPHFFQSLAFSMGVSLYMSVSKGNCHHQVEALFKAFGRALGEAISVTGSEIPSSKGSLS